MNSQPRMSLADAAEMLWVCLANVSGGDWTRQSEEWQKAAARWRDAYHEAKGKIVPVEGQWVVAPSEALFMFGAWLTSREKVLTCSRAHEVPPLVEAISKFCAANGFEEPRQGYEKHMVQPGVEE